MNVEDAKKVLADSIGEYGNITTIRNEDVAYTKGQSVVLLDGYFTLIELEAVVVYAKSTMGAANAATADQTREGK